MASDDKTVEPAQQQVDPATNTNAAAVYWAIQIAQAPENAWARQALASASAANTNTNNALIVQPDIIAIHPPKPVTPRHESTQQKLQGAYAKALLDQHKYGHAVPEPKVFAERYGCDISEVYKAMKRYKNFGKNPNKR
jgi:hypothetical protein